jgi:hypothetical protein
MTFLIILDLQFVRLMKIVFSARFVNNNNNGMKSNFEEMNYEFILSFHYRLRNQN